MDSSKGIGRIKIFNDVPDKQARAAKQVKPPTEVKMQGASSGPIHPAQSSVAAAVGSSSVAASLHRASTATLTGEVAAKRYIKLMADYYSFPLWEASPGEYGDIDPKSLPISAALRRDLLKWSNMYTATLDMDDPASAGFKSAAEKRTFLGLRDVLATRLRQELPRDVELIVFTEPTQDAE